MGGGDSSEWQQAIGGDQEHLSSSHRQPSADPPSPDSTDPKISAYYNVTSTSSSRPSTVRALDLRTSWAPCRSRTKAHAPFFKEPPYPHTIFLSFWEWVAPYTIITRWSLLRSWVLILKELRNFMYILSTRLPNLFVPTWRSFTVPDTEVAPFPYLMWGVAFTACVVFSFTYQQPLLTSAYFGNRHTTRNIAQTSLGVAFNVVFCLFKWLLLRTCLMACTTCSCECCVMCTISYYKAV